MSEKDSDEDMKKLKKGVIGVVILLVLAIVAPMLINEMIGVDVSDLASNCLDDDGNQIEGCELEGNELVEMVSNAMTYISIAVGLIAFIYLIVVGVRY